MAHALGLRGPKDLLDEIKANRRSPGAPELGVVKAGFEVFCKATGVDDGLGLVFGFGLITAEDGKPYTDTQGNTITDPAMEKATTAFMKGARTAGEQHERESGVVVHSWPLSAAVAKAMGIQSDKCGWMVAVAPDPATLAKFKSGELTGFSIAGRHNVIDGKPVT